MRLVYKIGPNVTVVAGKMVLVKHTHTRTRAHALASVCLMETKDDIAFHFESPAGFI